MQLFIPREPDPAERRVSMLPELLRKLVQLGADVRVASGIGATLHIDDTAYEKAGATIMVEQAAALREADMILRLRPPSQAEISHAKRGSLHIGYLDPFNRPELVAAMATAGVSALSVEMIPRSTIAQKMDALSSQASLAGYEAVILAAAHLHKILPMMMTPAGTIAPARVFVIGAGVAGLQAIATAKRLGARVEAFDTRPVVKEQVESLGARFLQIELGETGESRDGYAKALSAAQLQKQQEAMARHCMEADVVITTAQIFGKKAPLIVTEEMVKSMHPGSVIVDLAVETGGNVAGSRLDQEVDINGVTILGVGNMPGRVPLDASRMYANNLYNFIEHFWDQDSQSFNLKLDDEIIKGCLITHNGEVVHPLLQSSVTGK